MECKICLDSYNDADKRPRNLPCGHTFCSPCIEDLIRQSMLVCPNCRARHSCSSAYNFPFAYELEELINKMRSSILSGRSEQEERKICKIQEEQQDNLNRSLSKCKDILVQLQNYKCNIRHWITEHEDLVTELRALIELNAKVQQQLKRQEEVVGSCLGEGEEQKQMLKLALDALSLSKTPQDVVTAMNDAECCHTRAEDWAQKCQELFPDVNTVYNSVKIRTEFKKAIKTIAREMGDDVSIPVHIGDNGDAVSIQLLDSASNQAQVGSAPELTIIHKLDNIVGMEPLTLETLRGLSHQARQLIAAGQVAAIHHDQGHPRYARVSLHDNFLCLHYLRDIPPPADTHIVQHSELLSQVDNSSTLVFLDVSWPGAPPRRLYIRVSPYTPRGKQFCLLCTGEQGHSYASTKLLKVVNKGKPGECIRGGDYDNNDGTGGAALMVGLARGGEYMRSDNAGAVWGRWGDECRGGQFYITTRSRPGAALLTVFGQVESGLEVLRSAVNLPNINHCSVSDCGIVVPH